MATSRETLQIVLQGKDEGASGAVSGVGKALSGLASVAGGIIASGIIMNITRQLGDLARESIQTAIQTSAVSNTFEKLADSIGEDALPMMDALRVATRGMVADSDLMQAANKFMAMGLADTQEEAAKLAEIATQLGMAMGEDATSSMENFALMLANQSIPRLDSFGISSGVVRTRIEELMAANEGMTRETAFMTATMEQAEITMGKVGEQSDNAAAAQAKMAATSSNLKTEIGTALLPIIAQFNSMLVPIVQEYGPKLVALFTSLATWASDNLGPALDGVNSAWGRLVTYIQESDAFAALLVIWGKISAWANEYWPAIESVLIVVWANIEDAVRTSIGIIEGVLTVFLQILAGDWAGAWQTAQGVVETYTAGMSSIVTRWWDAIMGWFGAGRQYIEGAMGGMFAGLRAWWEEHGQSVMTIVNVWWGYVTSVYEAGRDAVMTIWNALVTAATWVWDHFGDEITALTSGWWKAVQFLFEDFGEILGNIIDAIAALLTGDWETFGNEMGDIVEIMWRNIKNAFTAWADTLLTVMSGIVNSLIGIWQGIDWAELGANIIRGIVNGITSGIQWVKDAASNAAQAALDAAKGLLGISSPSKVMAEIGKYFDQGLAVGINANLGPVAAAGAGAGMAAAGATTNVTNNYTVNGMPIGGTGDIMSSLRLVSMMA